MNRTFRLALTKASLLIATVGLVVFPARSQSSGEKVYKSRCAICHAVDGSGNTPTGKRMHLRDLRSPEVQKQTDAQLIEIITKGKKDMPAYEKALKEAQIKELVAYIRETAKNK